MTPREEELLQLLAQLEEGSSVRRMLEGVYRPLDGAVREGETSKGAGSEEAVVRQQKGSTLPLELLRRALDFVIIDEEERPRDVDLSCFRRMRQVSRTLKDVVETAFPNTLHRYVNRIVRTLLHVEGKNRSLHVAELSLTAAALFDRAKQLRIWLAGDDVGAVNAILAAFTHLEKLVVCVTSQEAGLFGLELDMCHRLRSLHVVALSLEGPSPDEQLCRWFGDVHTEDRPLNNSLVHLNRTRRLLAPPSLVSLRIGFIYFGRRNIFQSLKDLIRSHVAFIDFRNAGALPREAIECMGLDAAEGPARLDFRGSQIDDDAIAGMTLERKETLAELDLSHTRLVNPAVLQLSENHSISHLNLSDNNLSSVHFGLGRNRHLRALNLSGALAALGNIAAALSELGEQLQDNTVLEELFLDRNGITSDAMLALRLASGTTGLGLCWISLASNIISNAGLRTMMPLMASLRCLDVRGNRNVTGQCALELSSETRTVLQGPADTSWMHWKEEGRVD